MAAADPAGQQAELGELLAGAVRAVVEAQGLLDDHARAGARAFADEPVGGLALPPLWFAFDAVSIEIEMSAEIVRRATTAGPPSSRLVCRTVNPFTAGVFGYSAATGTRVRVDLAPQRVVPSVPPREATPSPT